MIRFGLNLPTPTPLYRMGDQLLNDRALLGLVAQGSEPLAGIAQMNIQLIDSALSSTEGLGLRFTAVA